MMLVSGLESLGPVLRRCSREVKLLGSCSARAFASQDGSPRNPREDSASVGDSRLSQLTILEAAHRDNNPAADEQEQQGGQVMSPHLLDACAARMEAYKDCHAIAQETLVTARDQSASSQMRHLHGRAVSSLGGIPLALKGNYGVRNIPMRTHRTRLIPPGYRPAYDATLVKRLSDAGMVFVGATPFDEFGIGARDMFAVPDAVLSPWRSKDKAGEARTAGGMSSASAVTVAAGMAYGALASDLGGSLRAPAAYTGIVGFKPSPGRLSKAGLITFAARFDIPCVVTRTVPDAALLTALLQGQDEGDPDVVPACEKLTSLLDVIVDRPADVENNLPALLGLKSGDKPLEGITVGVTKEQLAKTSWPVQASMAAALESLQKAGAAVKEVGVPNPDTFTADMAGAFYRLAVADAFTAVDNLESMLPDLERHRYDDEEQEARGKPHLEHLRDIFNALEKGAQQGKAGASLDDARRFQDSITSWFDDQLSSQVDVFLLPATPGVSPTVSEAARWSPAEKSALDAFNLPATLAGLPAITVPVALSASEGLPIGLQLVGPRLAEARLLAVAGVVEQAAEEGAHGDGLLPLKASTGSTTV